MPSLPVPVLLNVSSGDHGHRAAGRRAAGGPVVAVSVRQSACAGALQCVSSEYSTTERGRQMATSADTATQTGDASAAPPAAPTPAAASAGSAASGGAGAAMPEEPRPENIGVLALEMYFPSTYVAQADLEQAHNCEGKYTVGLGQDNLAFCDDREDITSIILSVVQSLFEKYSIDPATIGRVEVGTESLIDKSKSVKTSLVRLFGENADIEGITSMNACYGGTAALFNSVAWMESREWDGRYALVVAGDIAVYEDGPARPTGGCGAVALLIGPDAPLALEPGLRTSHVMDVYDFYKPTHSEYPVVDGKLSQRTYLECLDNCYEGYRRKWQKKFGEEISLDHFDYYIFHAPYNKLVQKGFSRIMLAEFLQHPDDPRFESVQQFRDIERQESLDNRELDSAMRRLAAEEYTRRVAPSCHVGKNVGNCYTASIFAAIVSLVNDIGPDLVGKRVGLYSYGSGSVSSLYSFVGRESSSTQFSFQRMVDATYIRNRLEARTQCSVQDFIGAMELRAAKYGQAPMDPDGPIDRLAPGTYYLVDVDERHRRTYERKPL